MNHWLALDADLRQAVVALVGLLSGIVVNWAVSSLAYEPVPVSPWSRRHPRDGRSIWLDRLPLVGWFRIRRHAAVLGTGSWIRPLLVELGMIAAAVALYRWEVLHGGLMPRKLPAEAFADTDFRYLLNFSFASHWLLFSLMVAASLIDLDEMTIPDTITVPGTLVGLAIVAFEPWSLLPIHFDPIRGIHVLKTGFGFRHPEVVMEGAPNVASLLLACGCFWLWCFGLLPRVWRTRHGYRKAWRIFAAHIARDSSSWKIAAMAAVGTVAIAFVWYRAPLHWIGLITGLVGMAAGGAIVWVVRIIGGWALRQEAMGFGDVTLLAMIGAFLGWQPAVLVFFAAPGAALFFGLVKLVLHREKELPYGPFLCLAASGLLIGWSPIWQAAGPRFAMGWLIPGVLVVGFALLAVILRILQCFRSSDA